MSDKRRTVKADANDPATSGAIATEIGVTRVLAGSTSGEATVWLHQIIDPTTQAPFEGALKPGGTYVLFITPFTFGAGTAATGQWVAVGGQGIYEQTGATLRRSTDVPSGLPQTVSEAALLSQAR